MFKGIPSALKNKEGRRESFYSRVAEVIAGFKK
jgi:hypothetical protein